MGWHKTSVQKEDIPTEIDTSCVTIALLDVSQTRPVYANYRANTPRLSSTLLPFVLSIKDYVHVKLLITLAIVVGYSMHWNASMREQKSHGLTLCLCFYETNRDVTVKSWQMNAQALV